jgi:hypothetical protein
MAHECYQEENIGRFKEFIENSKGVRGTLTIIAITILLQVGTFLYLWGGIVTTVKIHDKSIDALMARFDKVKIVGYAVAGEKGEKGEQGIQGEPGKDYELPKVP